VVTEIAKATVSMIFLDQVPISRGGSHPVLEIARCSSANPREVVFGIVECEESMSVEHRSQAF
jgi:hypothetical protein